MSARDRIEMLTETPQIGHIYTGRVVRTTDFGAFVEILPNVDGMVHISQLDSERVEKVEDIVTLATKSPSWSPTSTAMGKSAYHGRPCSKAGQPKKRTSMITVEEAAAARGKAARVQAMKATGITAPAAGANVETIAIAVTIHAANLYYNSKSPLQARWGFLFSTSSAGAPDILSSQPIHDIIFQVLHIHVRFGHRAVTNRYSCPVNRFRVARYQRVPPFQLLSLQEQAICAGLRHPPDLSHQRRR
jgi:hypothetical protein